MQTGIIKHWDAGKGYGFIVSNDDEDIFLHANDLDITLPANTIQVGLKVKFDIRRDMKGDKAINVRRV